MNNPTTQKTLFNQRVFLILRFINKRLLLTHEAITKS